MINMHIWGLVWDWFEHSPIVSECLRGESMCAQKEKKAHSDEEYYKTIINTLLHHWYVNNFLECLIIGK